MQQADAITVVAMAGAMVVTTVVVAIVASVDIPDHRQNA